MLSITPYILPSINALRFKLRPLLLQIQNYFLRYYFAVCIFNISNRNLLFLFIRKQYCLFKDDFKFCYFLLTRVRTRASPQYLSSGLYWCRTNSFWASIRRFYRVSLQPSLKSVLSLELLNRLFIFICPFFIILLEPLHILYDI